MEKNRIFYIALLFIPKFTELCNFFTKDHYESITQPEIKNYIWQKIIGIPAFVKNIYVDKNLLKSTK